MRTIPLLFALVVGCSTGRDGLYVPGGADLDARTKRRYREAVRFERNGEPERARPIIEDLSRTYPTRLGLHLHRLRLVRALEGPEAAAALYDPAPPGVDAERAGILSDLARLPADDPAQRKALLEYAVSREPQEPFWRLGLADVGLTTHDLLVDRARQELALGDLASHADSLEEARQMIDRAREDAAEAQRLDPQLSEAELMLGFIETRAADLATDPDERDERRELAITRYKQAIRLDPEAVEARINLAETMLYFSRFGQAAEALQQASELAPRDPRIWTNLGYTYYSVDQVGEAIACYRRALLYKPGDIRIRVALSDCERQRGNHEAAIGELLQARADAGEDRGLQATIAFKLAAIHEFDGRYPKAVAEYERHIELGGRDSAKARSRIRHIYERAFE
ncbi:MAG: tetratricopeptide repeat protein [Planctomycetota bacterium]